MYLVIFLKCCHIIFEFAAYFFLEKITFIFYQYRNTSIKCQFLTHFQEDTMILDISHSFSDQIKISDSSGGKINVIILLVVDNHYNRQFSGFFRYTPP